VTDRQKRDFEKGRESGKDGEKGGESERGIIALRVFSGLFLEDLLREK
jgi:hypothetical protein